MKILNLENSAGAIGFGILSLSESLSPFAFRCLLGAYWDRAGRFFEIHFLFIRFTLNSIVRGESGGDFSDIPKPPTEYINFIHV